MLIPFARHGKNINTDPFFLLFPIPCHVRSSRADYARSLGFRIVNRRGKFEQNPSGARCRIPNVSMTRHHKASRFSSTDSPNHMTSAVWS